MVDHIALLGGGGRIARHVVALLDERDDVALTLLLRDAAKAPDTTHEARVVEADVLDEPALEQAVRGQHAVYANLTGGDLDDQARAVVTAMQRTGVRRLVFVVSLGIYDEVPGEFGEWNRQQIGEALKPFRRAADVIEASDLDYTLVRPAWLTDADEVDYETTGRDEPFRGTEVSRRSVAAFIVTALDDPARWSRTNVGVDKPGSDGPKPSFA